MTRKWLIVERPDNWETDKENNFRYFGIPKRKIGMANEISAGDILFVYVSKGISKFSDIRVVKSNQLKKLNRSVGYDDIFPYAIVTKPLITLPAEKWVPVKNMIAKLSFTKDLKDWRPMFRSSIRELTDQDAVIIRKRIETASSA